MAQPNVIVDPYFRTMDEVFSPKDRAYLESLVTVIHGEDEPMSDEAFLQALPDAEVIICADWRYGDVLPQAKKLRAIFLISGAFSLHLDYDYCYKNNIRVLSVAPAFARQVAEMCLGMALDAAREISPGDRAMRAGEEIYLKAGNKNTFMLFDQPVGIIGYGNIAKALHPLLKPFNVEMSVYDPWLSERYLRLQDVIPVSLDDLLENSKVIFVLAAPTVDNQAMLSREKLALIQKNAVLVLMSRAHVVDFEAMTDMLLEGRFKAAIDVFPVEPFSKEHRIRNAEHAVLSAHRAGSVREGLWEIGEMVLDDLESVLKGLPPQRLQRAEPELTARYAVNTAKKPG